MKITFLAVGCAVLIAAPLPAATPVYEGFDYGGGTISGQVGGIGFGGAPWIETGSTADRDVVQTGSLNFQSLTTSGNSASSLAPNDFFTTLSRDVVDLPGTVGTSLWVSFLLRKVANSSPADPPTDYFGLVIYGTSGAGLFIGDPSESDTYSLGTVGVASSGSEISAVPLTLGTTAFLVARIDFLSGNEAISLFVNPAPGGATPAFAVATTSLNLGNIDAIGIEAGLNATWSHDEIRIGNTFADVAPVPEPAAGLLLGLGGMLLLRRRRNG